MQEEKILRKVLQDANLKITLPRLIIFRLLLAHGPQSIAELAKRSYGRVDRVSVYRSIDLYEKLGIVKRLALGWKYTIELSEIFLDHHHHLTCLGCNKTIAVREDELIEKMITSLGEETGFLITTHQLELQGYCQQCRSRQGI